MKHVSTKATVFTVKIICYHICINVCIDCTCIYVVLSNKSYDLRNKELDWTGSREEDF